VFRSLIPSGYQYQVESRLHAQLEELYRAWRADHETRNPAPPIENIRFTHDPNWRYRIASIQSAHDGNRGIWKATKVVWVMMGGAI
jgi:hypothetical protein